MSKKDYSAELLKMEGVQIEKLEENANGIELHVSLRRKAQQCPRCGAETDRIHDYRTRQVRDLELRGQPCNYSFGVASFLLLGKNTGAVFANTAGPRDG